MGRKHDLTARDQHTEPTLAALEAGRHVLLEKPMASTVEDCARICEAAKRANGHLMVGHACCCNPRHATAKREKIGKIVALSSRRNIPAFWTAEMMNNIEQDKADLVSVNHFFGIALPPWEKSA